MKKTNLFLFYILVVTMLILGRSKVMSSESENLSVIQQIFLTKNIDIQTQKYIDIQTQNIIENTVKSWNAVFLNDKYIPDANVQYVLMPSRNEKDVDKVAARYSVGDETITIIQTMCVFAMQVDLPKPKQTDDKKQQLSVGNVEILVKKILKRSSDTALNIVLNDPNRIEGNVKSQQDPNTKEPVWLKTMSWSQEANSTRFYFIKDDGMPSSSSKGFGVYLNKNWFSMVQKNKIGNKTGEVLNR